MPLGNVDMDLSKTDTWQRVQPQGPQRKGSAQFMQIHVDWAIGRGRAERNTGPLKIKGPTEP